jgi:hypothetical protein
VRGPSTVRGTSSVCGQSPAFSPPLTPSFPTARAAAARAAATCAAAAKAIVATAIAAATGADEARTAEAGHSGGCEAGGSRPAGAGEAAGSVHVHTAEAVRVAVALYSVTALRARRSARSCSVGVMGFSPTVS